MSKTIDLTKTVYEITEEHPEAVDIMASLGFGEITKEAMRNSVGRVMTIPKGSKMKGVPLDEIVAAFEAAGFEVVGQGAGKAARAASGTPAAGSEPAGESSPAKQADPAHAGAPEAEPAPASPQEAAGADPAGTAAPAGREGRAAQLKGYLSRLNAGEDLETVKADFAREFESVDATEIMEAEQELLGEGAPVAEVSRLCDVHSALFHGMTAQDMVANAERAVAAAEQGAAEPAGRGAEAAASAQGAQGAAGHAAIHAQAGNPDVIERASRLESVPGHPLNTFTRENEALTALLGLFRANRDAALLPKIREVAIHYAKKGDLLYPVLKVNHGIAGPSQVMWTVDDEIRDELGRLVKETDRGGEWDARVDAVLQRAEEMVFKEQNILFAVCAANFTDGEWRSIYRDSKDYAACFGVQPATWEEAEGAPAAEGAGADRAGEVVMPGGHLTVAQITALLNTIPMEITFVDDGNVNRFFNEGPKDFKRPGMAIDREVFSCHPPKVEAMVRQIIQQFRDGTADCVPVWMEKNGHTLLVRYTAVRDRDGNYVGTAEFVQNMDFAKEHFLGEGA